MRNLIFWTTFLLVLPQALWVRRTAPRTPAAEGPRSAGTPGEHTLHLLGLGDSIIDGVGVSHTGEALTAQVAAALADRGVATRWTALGKSGSRTAQIATLLDDLPETPVDLVIISAGVNDVTGLTGAKDLRYGLGQIAERLRHHSPAAQVVLLGVPPMWKFPALPQPLRWVVGQRARMVQAWGARAAQDEGWQFLPSEFDPRPGEFAEDGYHPNAASIRQWAADITARLRNVPSPR